MKKKGDKVNAKKLTESAMLSALLVMVGVLFISSFIGYQVYLDFIVPVLITLIYLRCDFKYTLLSALTSVALITFIFGNPAYSLWMVQNMSIGFFCGFLIKKDKCLMDDLLYCSLFATLILVFADIFLSGIIGYSFMAEAKEALKYIEGYSIVKDVVFYLLLAALPLGTVVMTYLCGLLIGKKLRLLNENALRKFLYIRKYKRYGSLQYCSVKTSIIGLIYVLFMIIIGKDNFLFNITYFKTVLITMNYIILYFLIKDSYSMIASFIYKITSKAIFVMVFQLTAIYSLFKYFTITACALIMGGAVMDFKFKVRNNTDRYLRKLDPIKELS